MQGIRLRDDVAVGSSFRRRLVGLLATIALALSSEEARALGPIGLEIGTKVGYGTSPGGAAVNPLGLGLGVRAGLTLSGLYVGLSAVDYLGSSDGNGGQYHAIQLGGELGLGFKIHGVTIRPQIGAGDVSLSGSLAGLTSPGIPTAACLYVEPGVAALVSVGGVYLGVDAGALVIAGEPAYVLSGSQYVLTTSLAAAFAMHAQAGIKF
jgi:hypothetical protein